MSSRFRGGIAGWRNESVRHSLAARGVKTKYDAHAHTRPGVASSVPFFFAEKNGQKPSYVMCRNCGKHRGIVYGDDAMRCAGCEAVIDPQKEKLFYAGKEKVMSDEQLQAIHVNKLNGKVLDSEIEKIESQIHELETENLEAEGLSQKQLEGIMVKITDLELKKRKLERLRNDEYY